MNDFGFGFDPENLDFNNFANTGAPATGPYIPEARDCRSCGMCVNTCPTYKVKFEENYGPRGRVRLIDRVINDGEPLNEEELAALHACTQCRACETVCPSRMQYAELYSIANDKLGQQTQRNPWLIKLLLRYFSTQRWMQNASSNLVQLYQQSGMQWLVRKLPILKGELKQLDKLLPPNHSSKSVPYYSRALTPARYGKIALFSGCLSNTFDTQTHNDTIKILTRLGYDVYVPKTQTCCGAMHAHNGDKASAVTLAKQNLEAFSESRVSAIVFNASGCGAFLQEYPSLLEMEEEATQHKLTRSTTDVISFLQQIEWPESPMFRISRLKVAVHEPCSQRNHLKNEQEIYQLLKKIPGLEVIPLPGNSTCCGAGGTRMLTHPELAEPMRDEKVKALIDSEADLLLSSNMACAMHLASGVREARKKIEVIHPVQLLARQLI